MVIVLAYRVKGPGSIPIQCYDSLGKWMYLRPGQPMPCEENWLPSLWYKSMGRYVRLRGVRRHSKGSTPASTQGSPLQFEYRCYSSLVLCVANTESAMSGKRCNSPILGRDRKISRDMTHSEEPEGLLLFFLVLFWTTIRTPLLRGAILAGEYKLFRTFSVNKNI